MVLIIVKLTKRKYEKEMKCVKQVASCAIILHYRTYFHIAT